MLRIILVMAAALLFGCLSGEDGKDGRDAETSVYTGVLHSSDTTVNGSAVYWDKYIWALSDSSVVNVWVRQGGGYLWQPPTWYVKTGGLGYVRIIDDEKVEPAYEYKIVVAN